MENSFNKAIYGLASCPDALQGRHALLLLPPRTSAQHVRAVIPAMSAKPLGIYPHVCGSTWSLIGPLTFSDIYKLSTMPHSMF